MRSMPRRILVTGGAGFVGSHLVDELAAAGDSVSVLDDLSRGRRTWLHPDAELHEVDLRDEAAVRRALASALPDAVVHLAALHFIPAVEDAPQLAWDVNVTGTRVLLEALVERPPGLVVFASTAAVYPDCTGPIDETCAPAPLDLYGRTKLEGERLVAELVAGTRVRAVVARIFNVVGKRETNPHVVPEIVSQLRRGAASVRLGNLESRRDYTDVRDVADALRRLLGLEADGLSTFNVGSGRAVSVADLVRFCEQILGRAIEIEVDAHRRRVEDRAELLADARLLRAATGWQPRWTLRETLADLLDASDAGGDEARA